jgi:hypothetical protein
MKGNEIFASKFYQTEDNQRFAKPRRCEERSDAACTLIVFGLKPPVVASSIATWQSLRLQL